MLYKEMTIVEGRKFLPNVWNIIPKPLTEENFFVEPWENREMRDCAEFRLGNGRNGSDEVFFFVTDEELVRFLKKSVGELYFFAAYNQINVCQMRARGTVMLEEDHPDVEKMKKSMRTDIKRRVSSTVSKLNKKEAEERFAILSNGLLFCFQIKAYAYQTYERG